MGLQSVVQVVEANVKLGPAAIAREIVDSGGRSLSAILRRGRLQLLRSAHLAIERTYQQRDTISSGILRDWLYVVPLLSAVQSPMDSGFKKIGQPRPAIRLQTLQAQDLARRSVEG